ncbi:hypothetical protein QEG73_01345 [Chitinophagaceae bacterium 26-R-25]|nr:hypothetical protein [Chitinophagaceae bacterium 26-R-25]
MRYIFLIVLVAACPYLYAQKLDKIKDLAKSYRYEEAKFQIDQYLADGKNSNDQDAWYTKARIYSDITNDVNLFLKYPTARIEAFDAIKKYVAMDSKKQYLQLQIDNYKPVMSIYQGYFQAGVHAYNNGDYVSALFNFKDCLAVGAYMYENKWSTVALDTNVVLYAGISAQKSGFDDQAAYYFGKLANAKTGGKGGNTLYQWLIEFYDKKGDKEQKAWFFKIGKEVYPDEKFRY